MEKIGVLISEEKVNAKIAIPSKMIPKIEAKIVSKTFPVFFIFFLF